MIFISVLLFFEQLVCVCHKTKLTKQKKCIRICIELISLLSKGQHASSVDSTATSQQEVPAFDYWLEQGRAILVTEKVSSCSLFVIRVINGGLLTVKLVKKSADRCGLSSPTPFLHRAVNSKQHKGKEVENRNSPPPAVAKE